MLINSLSLENFKCFEKLDVKFAPITLLTGANSSGKSSLIYSLLAVMQSKDFPFFVSPNGNYVNMGSFYEMAFNGNPGRCFKIAVSIDIENHYSVNKPFYVETAWSINSKNNLPKLFEIKYESSGMRFQIKNKRKKYFFTFKGSVSTNNPQASLYRIFDNLIKEGKVSTKLFHSSQDLSYHLLKINLKNLEINVNIEDFVEKLFNSDNWNLRGMSSDITEGFYVLEDNFNYIGSFRKPPERTYYQKTRSDKVGISGESYIDQIIEWEENNNEKYTKLIDSLIEMKLLSEIKATKLVGGRFELGVKSHPNGKIDSLTDVGFGISQFLPIVVADLQLSDESCLAVSQPEIHLHPKIQATFGNYLAKQVNETKKQYIIETHSEYLLNRIRLLLVTGELKPEDVKIYYFENDGIKSTVHDIEFTTNGAVKGAPDGFFETYEMDVMDIALNAVK